MFFVLFFKQKTAYEMRISDWSSDVCSSDLVDLDARARGGDGRARVPEPVRLYRRRHAGDGGQRRADGACRRLHEIGRGGKGQCAHRKSAVEGQNVSVRFDLGGRRILKKKKNLNFNYTNLVSN